MKLVRVGNRFTGRYSDDGVNWNPCGPAITVSLPSAALAGLAVTAHNDAFLNTSTFSNVTIGRAPTIAAPAQASNVLIRGTGTNVWVSGADLSGDSGLVYSWTTVNKPIGAPDPIFGSNGTFGAQDSAVTLSHAGVYVFQATVMNSYGLAATSLVSVRAVQTFSQIELLPPMAAVQAGGTQQFAALAVDQFGNALVSQPRFTWWVDGSGAGIHQRQRAFRRGKHHRRRDGPRLGRRSGRRLSRRRLRRQRAPARTKHGRLGRSRTAAGGRAACRIRTLADFGRPGGRVGNPFRARGRFARSACRAGAAPGRTRPASEPLSGDTVQSRLAQALDRSLFGPQRLQDGLLPALRHDLTQYARLRPDAAAGRLGDGMLDAARSQIASELSVYNALAGSAVFRHAIDVLLQQGDARSATYSMVSKVAATTTVAFSAGYLLWCLQGGTFFMSMLTAVPFWTWFDPLPVLDSWDQFRAGLSARGGSGRRNGNDDDADMNWLMGELPAN